MAHCAGPEQLCYYCSLFCHLHSEEFGVAHGQQIMIKHEECSAVHDWERLGWQYTMWLHFARSNFMRISHQVMKQFNSCSIWGENPGSR